MAGDNLPVKAEPQEIAKPVELPDWLGLHGVQSLSTFDSSTPDGLRLLTKMAGVLDSDLLGVMNTELDLVGFFMKPYQKIEADGEVKNLVFIGLLDAQGKTYSTSSIGVRQTILMIARQYGFKTWNPPIRVKVIPIPLDNGKTMYTLEFVKQLDKPPVGKSK